MVAEKCTQQKWENSSKIQDVILSMQVCQWFKKLDMNEPFEFVWYHVT